MFLWLNGIFIVGVHPNCLLKECTGKTAPFLLDGLPFGQGVHKEVRWDGKFIHVPFEGAALKRFTGMCDYHYQIQVTPNAPIAARIGPEIPDSDHIGTKLNSRRSPFANRFIDPAAIRPFED
jgi:hypothetical protein